METAIWVVGSVNGLLLLGILIFLVDLRGTVLDMEKREERKRMGG